MKRWLQNRTLYSCRKDVQKAVNVELLREEGDDDNLLIAEEICGPDTDLEWPRQCILCLENKLD